MAKRIKRNFHEQKELIELRRILTATTDDVNSYLKGFGSIVKLSQDLWITFPVWMKTCAQLPEEQRTLPFADTPEMLEQIQNPKYFRPDAETQLADLLVLRSFHETVLLTVNQLFDVRNKLATCRKKLQTESDLDSLRFVFSNEVMPIIISAPTHMGEAAMALKDVTDKYADSIRTNLPEHICATLQGFLVGAEQAVSSMVEEATQFPDVNLFDSTQPAADTPDVFDLTSGDDEAPKEHMPVADGENGSSE